MEDELWATVDAAIGGDRPALDSLFARSLPRLEAFVRFKAGGLHQARESVSDLVQSVCREALVDLDHFEYRGEEAFRSWLFLQASRKIVDRVRHHRRAKRDVAREQQAGGTGEDGQVLAEFITLGTPSRHASAREEVDRVFAAMQALPENQLEAIGLVRVLGLSYVDAAEQMGCSQSSVRNLVARALASVATSITDG